MIKQLLNHAGAMAVAISVITGGSMPVYGADGDEFTDDYFIYKVLSENNKTATLSGHTQFAISGLSVPSTVKSPDGTQYTVTEISEKAFSGFEGLQSLIIAESITKIGAYAFSECKNFHNVVLPVGLTEIANYTFSKCHLKSIIIPSNVTTIGVSAFADNSGLKTITLTNPTPPTLKTVRGAASPFANCAENVVVYVPKESVSKYQAAAVWKLLPTFVGMGKFEVTVTPSELTLKVGETATLTANVVKEDEVEITGAGWSPVIDNVATAALDINATQNYPNSQGIVTAHGAGTARIRYSVHDAAGRSAEGVCEVTVYDPAGINNVTSENGDATAEYYNLQGMRVENPSAGIYLHRQGGTVTKVVIR